MDMILKSGNFCLYSIAALHCVEALWVFVHTESVCEHAERSKTRAHTLTSRLPPGVWRALPVAIADMGTSQAQAALSGWGYFRT